MTTRFSVLHRETTIQDLCSEELDLLIIGGGITGAGILLDARARGMRAAVIEMQDFAAGTSSRSTKLVHGGLRYLKQFEIGLVAEVGKERAIVYENGPHVTTPVWMLLPVLQGGSYGRIASSFGIYVYDILAGVKHSERRKMLTREQTLAQEPLLRTAGLKGAGYYVEYRTDDARLTLEILKEAASRGAFALNYTKAEKLLYKEGRVIGAQVRDRLTNRPYEVFARKVVNAAGPWVDELREQDGSKRGKTLHLTKGVHIVIDGKKFPLKNSIYFDVPDGRMIFAIPREGKTYIGTTDTNYNEDLLHPRMTVEDRDYLVQCVNFMFPSIHLKPADVESSWAGVRPLIHEEGKGPSEISRKDEVFRSETGLITIAGGKLTGYRKMADKVVSLAAQELERETSHHYPACSTDSIEISGGKFGGSQNLPVYVSETVPVGVRLGLTEEQSQALVHRYGTNVEAVFEILRTRSQETVLAGLPLDVFGTLVYGIESEMVVTPSDFFIRRTGNLYFHIDWVRQFMNPVIHFMENYLVWNEETSQHYRQELEDRLREAVEPLQTYEKADSKQDSVQKTANSEEVYS